MLAILDNLALLAILGILATLAILANSANPDFLGNRAISATLPIFAALAFWPLDILANLIILVTLGN